jgi:peptide/nickel transport system permease protein
MTAVATPTPGAAPAPVPAETPEPPSHFVRAMRRRRRRLGRYLRNREVTVAGSVFLLVVLFVFLGPYIFGLPGPNSGLLLAKDLNLPLGSPGHLLGTDADGNDLFSRLLYGGRVSIEVGLASASIGFIIGSLVGTVAGYLGGVVDVLVCRLIDIQFSFPALILALAIASYLGPSELHVIYALSFNAVPGFARLTRGAALRLRERDFIAASRAMGAPVWHVMRRHMSPNIVPQLLTYFFLQVGTLILAEAGLSFLGAGIPLPQPSWGNMIKIGQDYLRTRPDLVMIPGAMLFITILSLNLLANGVRTVASSESE